jgi:hypothetical protein
MEEVAEKSGVEEGNGMERKRHSENLLLQIIPKDIIL